MHNVPEVFKVAKIFEEDSIMNACAKVRKACSLYGYLEIY